ncbi:copper chaperone PCu(A)C [Streptomyces sp. NPDC005529]|uniref:copper chaperone PCu(A)C n=1 Tax=unclassified Streptomyces TaxID=2593676 RepID=UPI0033BA9E9D
MKKTSTDIKAKAKTAWIRWIPHKGVPHAGYITLENSSDKQYEITKVTSSDYRNIEFYEEIVDSESRSVVRRDKAIVTAKRGLAFEPGGFYLMFKEPTRSLTPGNSARVVFFLDDGTVFKIRMPIATSRENL